MQAHGSSPRACCLLGNERTQTLDLFFGCFGTTIVVRRNVGTLSLSSCKIALSIAGAILGFVALTLSIAQTVLSRLKRTFCIGGTLFGFLEFRAQFFKLGIRSTAGTATRDRHSTMPAVV